MTITETVKAVNLQTDKMHVCMSIYKIYDFSDM